MPEATAIVRPRQTGCPPRRAGTGDGGRKGRGWSRRARGRCGPPAGLRLHHQRRRFKAAEGSDWSPLANRDVVVWPDADVAGAEYARDVARLAQEAGARSVRIVDVSGFLHGFDLGDAIPPTLDIELRIQGARECARYFSFAPFTMDPVRGLFVELEKKGELERHFVSDAFGMPGPSSNRGRPTTGRDCCAGAMRTGAFMMPLCRMPNCTGEARRRSQATWRHKAWKVSTGKGRQHLARYLNEVSCGRRLFKVERTGWYNDQPAFVLPAGTIGGTHRFADAG